MNAPPIKVGRDFALLSVNIVDGTRREPQPDQAILVRDGRIAAITPMSSFRHTDGVDELPLDGHTVMPGLIDAHVHLAGGRADVLEQEHGTAIEPTLLRAMRSVHQAQQLLRRGVTTVRDISWNGLYLKRLFVEQQIPGPKVVACGPGLTRTGGHADLHQLSRAYAHDHGPWGYLADGPHEVVKAVRHLLREGADAIKVFASGGDNWPHDRMTDVHYSAGELRACVEEAHRQRGTIVAAHAENREAIRLAVEAGRDTIEHGEDLDERLASEMARRGTILVPTLELIVNWERDFLPSGEAQRDKTRPDAFLYRDRYDHADAGDSAARALSSRAVESFQLARAAGVQIALGSDTVFEPLTPYGEYSIRELKALIEHGMSGSEALRSATSVSARAAGMDQVLGSVEVGKLADLLVLRKDPSNDIDAVADPANIFLTFCDGRLTVQDQTFVW